jgi:hypothetical protein
VVDLVVVVGVNVAFVNASIYGEKDLLVIAQVLLSMFKVAWNSFCTSYLLKWIVMFFDTAESADVASVFSETNAITLQVFVAQINNIVIPRIVVAVISPNCFYNLFVAAPSVESKYSYEFCNPLSPQGQCFILQRKTSYDPPFSDNFQCSSSLITYYAPAFILYSIVCAFCNPLSHIAVALAHRNTRPDSRLRGMLGALLQPIHQPLPPGDGGGDAQGTEYNDSIVEDSQIQEQDQEQNQETTTQTKLARQAHGKRGVIACREKETTTFHRSDQQIYFNANRTLLNLLTFLGILLTFGAMFPPLAVALLMCIFCTTIMAKLSVGRFLSVAAAQKKFRYVEILQSQCSGVGTALVLQNSVLMLVTLSCCFYTLFLFDTLGDSVGFGASYWVIIVVPLLAPVLYLLYTFYARANHLEASSISMLSSSLEPTAGSNATDAGDVSARSLGQGQDATSGGQHYGHSDDVAELGGVGRDTDVELTDMNLDRFPSSLRPQFIASASAPTSHSMTVNALHHVAGTSAKHA